MDNGYEVVVDEERDLSFPARCVVCGHMRYGPGIKVQGSPVGYFGLWTWQFCLNQKIVLPAHPECGRKLRRSIVWRQIMLFVAAALAMGVAMYLDWGRLAAIGAAFVLITPPILWQIHNPLSMEFWFRQGKIEFVFKERSYADEFASLNDAVVED